MRGQDFAGLMKMLRSSCSSEGFSFLRQLRSALSLGDVDKGERISSVTPVEVMRGRYNVDVRICNEALSIDRNTKTVLVKNHVTGEEYIESYDKLVIATGSSPAAPRIPGLTLRAF